MKYNPDVHHRRSIRLRRYDYSQPGAYFITICTHNRECLFGDVVDGKMVLNDGGKMIGKWFYELENKFPNIQCDEFICMPNHVHFIVINNDNATHDRANTAIVGADLRVCPNKMGGLNKMGEHNNTLGERENTMGEHTGSPLHRVVQWFKTMTTNEYIRRVKQHGWPPFPGKLWQRNYWEHIIRLSEHGNAQAGGENELNQIRQYIINNPLNWETDKNYDGL